MANVDAPFGFRPIRYRSGQPYNGACNLYYIPSTDATAMFVGDAVSYATANMTTAEGAPYIKQSAAAGEVNVGVIVGFKEDTSSSEVYRPASTPRYAWVADDINNLVCEVQNSGYFSVTQTHHYGEILVGTGSTVTGLSAMEINSSGLITTAAQLRVVRLAAKPDNSSGTSTTDADGRYAIVEVFFNETAWDHL